MYLRVLNAHGVSDCNCSAKNIVVGSCAGATCPIPVIPDNVSGSDDTSVCANDIIDSVEIEIGGQRIDKHYGDWLNIWTELTTPASKAAGTEAVLNLNKGHHSYIPLQFWFNRNPGLALPLIALQYHEVKLNIEFSSASAGDASCGGGRCEKTPIAGAWSNAKLFVDYIYLDTDERRRFAQVSHEYLIEQLQFTGAETIASGSTNTEVRLNFNHPVKELIWRASGVATRANLETGVSGTTGNNEIVGWMPFTEIPAYGGISGNVMSASGVLGNIGLASAGVTGMNYSPVFKYNPDQAVGARTNVNQGNQTDNVCASAQWAEVTLQLNGHERFAPRHSEYFRLVQPLQHHTAIPVNSGIHCYSFALKPEEHQPSGTCNFSRIDNAVLKLNGQSTQTFGVAGEGSAMTATVLKVYAVNYNVLRIMSGMGGLAYSN
jgi:hypothetical protein